MKVGFIGLGNMGWPMAERLLAAGHELTLFNRTAGRSAALADRGARVAASPGEACRGEVVVTMPADDDSLDELAFAPGGVVDALSPGAVHVCMATISTGLAERLDEAHRERGHSYVSAPVLGRPEAAASGTMFILAGGPPAAIDRCRPLFDALGQRLFVAGDKPWTANLLKICNNFMVVAAIESLAEAFALVKKSGIERARLHEVLTEAMFTGPVHRIYGAMIAEDRYEPAGFRFALGLKDTELVLRAGERIGAPMPIAGLVRDRFVTGLGRGYRDLDWAALGRVAADAAGIASSPPGDTPAGD